MSDTTANLSKMKVVELRKELKLRGLAHTGDKAELMSRLQAAMAEDQDQEEHGDINLDSDEIDSDGVLEDDDDKSPAHSDLGLDDSAVELALQDPPTREEPKPAPKILKRKIKDTNGDQEAEKTSADNKGPPVAKKIILNRTTSITTPVVSTENTVKSDKTPIQVPVDTEKKTEKVKITADVDAKTKLEMRAKRFGLPIKMSDDERKEARKMRFTQGAVTNSTVLTGSLSENIDKIKKRAERFGQSVSKIMTDIEMKERLEKRKEKFGGDKVEIKP